MRMEVLQNIGEAEASRMLIVTRVALAMVVIKENLAVVLEVEGEVERRLC